MKNCLVFLCIITVCISCLTKRTALGTSKPSFNQKYLDKLEAGSTLLSAGYYQTLEATSSGNFILKTYFPETRQITHFYTYSDKKMTILDGLAKEYWDNGQFIFEGKYVNNQREGEWKRSLSFGLTTSTGHYKNNEPEGRWVEKDTAGQLRSEHHYLAGKLDGPFKVFDKDGILLQEGNYAADSLEWEKKYPEEAGTEDLPFTEAVPYLVECENPDKKAQKDCSEQVMLQSIYQNLRYPEIARKNDIKGTAIIRFVVEKDGSLTEIEVMRGLCKEIAAECDKVVRRMPPWSPGIQKGEAVRVQFTLPIKFKLE